jgi:hypothetical protein
MSKVVSKPKETPVFDLSKTYVWQPDDVFEITGEQLASFFHTLIKEVNDLGAPAGMKVTAFNHTLEVIKRGVEQGVITEAVNNEKIEEAEVVELFKQK